jgi:hypothetical protein
MAGSLQQQTTQQGRLEDSPKCPLTRGMGVEAGTSALLKRCSQYRPERQDIIGWAQEPPSWRQEKDKCK